MISEPVPVSDFNLLVHIANCQLNVNAHEPQCCKSRRVKKMA